MAQGTRSGVFCMRAIYPPISL